MNDPTFNLAQVAIHPTWYDHLDAVEGAMAECARVEALYPQHRFIAFTCSHV